MRGLWRSGRAGVLRCHAPHARAGSDGEHARELRARDIARARARAPPHPPPPPPWHVVARTLVEPGKVGRSFEKNEVAGQICIYTEMNQLTVEELKKELGSRYWVRGSRWDPGTTTETRWAAGETNDGDSGAARVTAESMRENGLAPSDLILVRRDKRGTSRWRFFYRERRMTKELWRWMR